VSVGAPQYVGVPPTLPSRTLYVGAGGGGDTVAAALRALADGGGSSRMVMGAGYAYEEYVTALMSGSSRNGVFTRPAYADTAGEAAIRAYVDSVLAPSKVPGVFQIQKPDERSEALKAAVFADTSHHTQDGVPAYDTQDSPYKYKTLLEESSLLKYVDLGDTHCFIAVTADRLGPAADEQLKSFKKFIKDPEMNIREIVLLDFGGDIFDLKPVMKGARDAVFLTLILEAMKMSVFPIHLRVEVYGPNVDAHDRDGPEHVAQKLKWFGPTRQLPGRESTMYHMLRRYQKTLTMMGILGPGRATGNWLAAAEVSDPGAALALTLDDFVDNYFKARKDFADLAKSDSKAAEALEVLAKASSFETFASVFVYESSDWRDFLSMLPNDSESKRVLLS